MRFGSTNKTGTTNDTEKYCVILDLGETIGNIYNTELPNQMEEVFQTIIPQDDVMNLLQINLMV